jgi:hypothetical protein
MDGIIGRSLVGNKLKRICLQNHVAESLRTMRNKPPSQHASASATKADDTVGSHFAEAPVKDPCMHHTSAVQRLLVPSCLLIGSQPPSQLITTTPSGGFFFERRISQLLSKANKGFVLHHSIATTHGHTQKKQAPHLNAMPLSQRERERGGGGGGLVRKISNGDGAGSCLQLLAPSSNTERELSMPWQAKSVLERGNFHTIVLLNL